MLKRNTALDGVRGLAVLIVFLSHTSGRDQAISSFLQFQGIGHIGVYLFFVLSAYLLTDHLLKEYEFTKDISLRNFFIRRFLRIAPLYYLIISAVYLYQIFTFKYHPKYLHIDGGFEGYLQHLFFYKGDGVFWTIPAEFGFYFLLPFFVLFLEKMRSAKIQLLLILLLIISTWSILSLLGIVNTQPKLVDIHHRSQFFEVFLCGIAAAYLKREPVVINYFHNQSGFIHRACGALLIVVLLLTCVLVAYKFFIFERPAYFFRWLSILYGVSFALIILATEYPGILTRFFNNKLLQNIGMAGFSWYLLHFLILQLVNQYELSSVFRFCLSLILVAFMSWISYCLIERPFMNLGKKLTRQNRTGVATVSAEAS